MLNPTRFLVKKVFDDEYELESSTITDKEVIEDMFVSEREVLWYYEVYDYIAKKYIMYPTRDTMDEMDKEFGNNHDTLDWIPIYTLGFRLKKN